MKRKRQTRKQKIEKSGSALDTVVDARLDMFESPESSNVEGAAYNLDTSELVLAVRDKKREGSQTLYYSYAGVTLADWEGFKDAESKGKYKNEVIIKKYNGVKLA